MFQDRILLSILLSTPLLFANEIDTDLGFEELLNDVSEIATKKSMNVDYLPSIVTVIDAQEYMDAGIINIAQALDMLPGIQMQLSPLGYTITTVRGFKNPNAYLSDKIKVMVDGVPIYNEVTGSSSFYMDFPLTMVDKIEVLRGPGSTIYGANAFYATVNIITKTGNSKENNTLMFNAGSHDYYSGAATLHVKAGDWNLFSDGYYQQNDKHIYSENRKRSTDEAFNDYSVGLRATNGNFDFTTRLKKSTSGNYYGFEGNIEKNQDKEHTNSYFYAQAKYKKNFNAYTFETKLHYTHRELDQEARLFDNPEALNQVFSVVDVEMNEGFLYAEVNHEDNYEAEMLLSLPTLYNNDMLVGAGVRYVHLPKEELYSSIEANIAANRDQIYNHANFQDFQFNDERESAYWRDPSTNLLKENVSRTILYAYAQDLIAINEKTDIALGLRVDNYSDFGAQFSKRAAIVYRADEQVIMKLLSGSAFRSPTFFEAYAKGHINFRAGDEDIKPEETNTYEAQLIYLPSSKSKIFVNLFYSQLKNVIDLEEFPNTDPGYQNYDLRASKGAEVELYYKSNIHHNLYFNATYLDTDYTLPADEESPIEKMQSMPDISKIMLKGIYIYKPFKELSFGTAYRYFGETTSTELDWIKSNPYKDPTLDEVHIFDETITYRFNTNTTLRLTVKNLFDADIRQPSYYYRDNGGVEREGREFFASFEQSF